MSLFTSSALPCHRRSVLLAPSHLGTIHNAFSTIRRDSSEHAKLLADAQRLRGRVYLADGAIERGQLTESGRHTQPADHLSFHLLSLDDAGRVAACIRYLWHENTVGFSRLGVACAPVVAQDKHGPALARSVEKELARARRLGYGYVEMGGWAVAKELRCTTEAVRMVVTVYALARLMGGALGISTVTRRHASSSILRRMGGAPLNCGKDEVSTYYDPNYRCEMEILRFDSDLPGDAYEGSVRRCHAALVRTPVIVPETILGSAISFKQRQTPVSPNLLVEQNVTNSGLSVAVIS